MWHNACSPYPQQIQDLTGDLLGGVAREFAEAGGLCDACILVTTPAGKSIVARLVTYGDENAPGDIDLSPQAYAALDGNDNGARPMTWQLAECPDTGTIRYQFQTEANPYWTSLWVRNSRVPIAKVEVKSPNHPTFFELTRGTDGTLTDAGGFGDGAFTLQITGIDGQVITDTFDSFQPGQVIVSTKQFQ